MTRQIISPPPTNLTNKVNKSAPTVGMPVHQLGTRHQAPGIGLFVISNVKNNCVSHIATCHVVSRVAP